MITEKEILDDLAKQFSIATIQEGELTTYMYSAEMKKRGIDMSDKVAKRILENLVKEKKWAVRDAITASGNKAKVYKPVIK